MPQFQAGHVESRYRSRGIGTALFTYLEHVAAQRGAAAIELLVGKANNRARALYTRLGYVTCGEDVARWTFREGDSFIQDSEDCWVMRKPLGRPTPIGYNTVTRRGSSVVEQWTHKPPAVLDIAMTTA